MIHPFHFKNEHTLHILVRIMRGYFHILAMTIVLPVFSLIVLCQSVLSGELPSTQEEFSKAYDEAAVKAQSHAVIRNFMAAAPLKSFLIIRENENVCAIRFTEFHRGHDAKPRTFFNSGHESLYAEYDWYSQTEDGKRFEPLKTNSGHRTLDQQPWFGISLHLSFQMGDTFVKCGPFKLPWTYPNNVGFTFPFSRKPDSNIELAPTNWQNISDIDLENKSLRWYRWDETREEMLIPIAELP